MNDILEIIIILCFTFSCVSCFVQRPLILSVALLLQFLCGALFMLAKGSDYFAMMLAFLGLWFALFYFGSSSLITKDLIQKIFVNNSQSKRDFLLSRIVGFAVGTLFGIGTWIVLEKAKALKPLENNNELTSNVSLFLLGKNVIEHQTVLICLIGALVLVFGVAVGLAITSKRGKQC